MADHICVKYGLEKDYGLEYHTGYLYPGNMFPLDNLWEVERN